MHVKSLLQIRFGLLETPNDFPQTVLNFKILAGYCLIINEILIIKKFNY